MYTRRVVVVVFVHVCFSHVHTSVTSWTFCSIYYSSYTGCNILLNFHGAFLSDQELDPCNCESCTQNYTILFPPLYQIWPCFTRASIPNQLVNGMCVV